MTLSARRADGSGSSVGMRHRVGATAVRPHGRHRVEAGS